MLTRHLRKLLWGFTVRLAAGSVRFGPCYYFNRWGGGTMTKQKQYMGSQLVFGAMSIGLIVALVIQLFFRIIS